MIPALCLAQSWACKISSSAAMRRLARSTRPPAMCAAPTIAAGMCLQHAAAPSSISLSLLPLQGGILQFSSAPQIVPFAVRDFAALRRPWTAPERRTSCTMRP